MDHPTPASFLSLGPRLIDLSRRRVDASPRPGQLLPLASEHLTRTEAAILRLLAAHSPATVTRDELLRSLWNLSPRSSRTLDTHITRLRRKLEDNPAAPRYLLTVYRVGYRLELPPDGSRPAGRDGAAADTLLRSCLPQLPNSRAHAS